MAKPRFPRRDIPAPFPIAAISSRLKTIMGAAGVSHAALSGGDSDVCCRSFRAGCVNLTEALHHPLEGVTRLRHFNRAIGRLKYPEN